MMRNLFHLASENSIANDLAENTSLSSSYYLLKYSTMSIPRSPSPQKE